MSKKSEYRSSIIIAFLEKHNLSPWDEIKFKINNKTHKGVILPRYELSEGDFLSIKLETGYNFGLEISKIQDIEKIGHSEGKYQLPKLEKSQKEDLPEVIIIGCGGTIASRLDYRTGAVIPAFTSEELLSMNEELINLAQIRTFSLFEKFSENMTINDWLKVAETVKKEYDNNKPKGIVLAHGTDTMSYGGAILAFALRNIPIPIIITGSQRSADRPSSDAFLNIMNATFIAAYSKFKGIAILMHSDSGDSEAFLHNPLNVRKIHTSRRNAFQSVNSDPLAIVDYRERKIKMNKTKANETSDNFEISTNFEETVSMVWIHPTINPSILMSVIENNKGIILLGTGLGHVPRPLIEFIKKGREIGKEFLMISQCLSGFVNMNVYDSGRELLNLGVISGLNMTPEAAYAKFSYGLANTQDHEALVNFMNKEYSNEFSNKRESHKNFI